VPTTPISPGSGLFQTATFGSLRRKVSRYLESRIRRHVPTRPLHVTSLKPPFYFYYCVPRKIRRGILLKTMCTRIFLSRPSRRPALQFSQRVFSLGFPWNEPMLARCFTARTPQFRLVYLVRRLSGMLFSEQDECFTRPFHLSRFRAGRLFHTRATTLFFFAVTAAAPCRDASVIFSYSRIP